MGWSDLASTGRVALGVFACALAVPGPGHAQDNREPATLSARPDVTTLQIAPNPPAPQAASMAADRKRELERWIRDYQKWQEWRHQWIRKGAISRDRKPRPQPPAWLPDECRDRTDASEAILVEACERLTDWNADDDLTADLRKANQDCVVGAHPFRRVLAGDEFRVERVGPGWCARHRRD